MNAKNSKIISSTRLALVIYKLFNLVVQVHPKIRRHDANVELQ